MAQDANDTRGFIMEQSPRFIAAQNGTVLDIQLEYGSIGGGRSHVLNHLYEVRIPPLTVEAQEVAETAEFNNQSTIQILSSERAIEVSSSQDVIVPSFYTGRTLLISSLELGNMINVSFGFVLRQLVSKQFLFKKVKVEVSDPPVGTFDVDANIPMAARRRTENYSFICPNGLTGLADGNPQPLGLSFLKYASNPGIGSSSRRLTSITDRPSRFIVRGCTLDPPNVFQSNLVTQLCTKLKDPVLRQGINPGNRTIAFIPKENVLNDLLAIRAVQCVGYTRVAGQVNQVFYYDQGIKDGKNGLEKGETKSTKESSEGPSKKSSEGGR